jgi:phosphatidylglycerol:prolipoprotein diacylglycerol transferase
VAELVDALGLGPSGATHESSSLSVRTNNMLNFLQNYSPDRVMLDFGIVQIYWYGFCLAFAMTIAIFIALKIGKKNDFKENDLLDLFFFLIIGGLIGARIYDIFLELPFYISNPWQTIKIWEGGLAIHGGIIAGLLILYFFSKYKKLKFWKLTAILTPALALGQAIGRFGNYFNQELFGRPTNLPWKIFIEKVNRPELFKEFTFFHPTFLYESLGLIVIFIVLMILINKLKLIKKNNIVIVSIYMLLYSILRFSLEFIKIDRTPEFLSLRWPQVMSLILIIISIVLFFYAKKNGKKGIYNKK